MLVLFFFLVFQIICNTNSFFSNTEEFGYFVQFTDVHLQYDYLSNTNADCEQTKTGVCCFSKDPEQKEVSGKYGYINKDSDTNWCDIPRITFEETIDYILDIPKNFDITVDGIFFSGDVPAHDYGQTKKANLEHLWYFYETMEKKLDGKKIPFFPVIGNHDTYPIEVFDFPGKSYEWLYENFTALFSKFLPSDVLPDVRKYGMYSTYLDMDKKIRIITLNSNLVEPLNRFVKNATIEEKKMVSEYLEKYLEQARANGEKVLISQHISLEYSNYWTIPEWNEQYQKLMLKYGDIILADIIGHYHLDYPQLVHEFNNPSKPVGVQYVLNSLPAWYTLVQPAIRIYKYSKTSFELVDYVQVYNDLEQSNKDLNLNKNWKILYSPIKEYNLEDLSPETWYSFLNNLKTDDELWEKFFVNYHVGYIKDASGCQDWCRDNVICFSLTNDIDSYNDCMAK